MLHEFPEAPVFPDLASTDVSAVITAPSAIVAERAMYYSSPARSSRPATRAPP